MSPWRAIGREWALTSLTSVHHHGQQFTGGFHEIRNFNFRAVLFDGKHGNG